MMLRQLAHLPLTSNQVLKNMHDRRRRDEGKQATREYHGPTTVGDVGKNISARVTTAKVGRVRHGVEADKEWGSLEVHPDREA